jgi:hypothetical protein
MERFIDGKGIMDGHLNIYGWNAQFIIEREL